MENFLEQQEEIFNNQISEPVLPNESEIIEVTSIEILSKEASQTVTCTCSSCLSILKKRITCVKTCSDKSKFKAPVESFVTKTKKNIKDSCQGSIEEYEESIHSVKDQIKKLESISSESASFSVKELDKINQESIAHLQNIKRLSSQINDSKELQSQTTVDLIRNEILAIMDDERVENVYEDGENIHVILHEINMEGTLVGPIDICFGPENTPKFYKTQDSNLSKNGYLHPHIDRSGSLCWGTAEELIANIFTTSSLFVRFDVTVNLLSKYNPDSPFEPLGNWAPSFCTNCEDVLCSDDCFECTCGAFLCYDCSLETGTSCCDDEMRCINCSERCPTCQALVCSNCLVNESTYLYEGCHKCGATGCVCCIRPCHSCEAKETAMCSECSWYCPRCDSFECDSCANFKEKKNGIYEYRCKLNHRNIVNKNTEDRIQPIRQAETTEIVERPRIRVLPVEGE